MSLTSHQNPYRGISNEWLTPPEIIKSLGPFDLDPCAAINQPWRTAKKQFTKKQNGLKKEWLGFTWVNPPFGPEAKLWLERLADHGNGIALIPARTETKWFIETIWRRSNSILFLHGRPHFYLPNGIRGKSNSGAPICLAGYGKLAYKRLKKSRLLGTLVTSWENI